MHYRVSSFISRLSLRTVFPLDTHTILRGECTNLRSACTQCCGLPPSSRVHNVKPRSAGWKWYQATIQTSIASWRPIKTAQRWGRACAMGVAIALVGCGSSSNPTESSEGAIAPEDPSAVEAVERPLVVATTSIVCDLTQQIAEDTIDLQCLLSPGQDPHVYAPAPSDVKAIEDADLLLGDGYSFVPQVTSVLEASQNTAPKVAVLEAAVPNPLMGSGHSHDHGEEGHTNDDPSHTDDHSHGHDEQAHDHDAHERAESVPDPHVWHDAENGIAMVNVIQENLVAIAPEHAELYTQNAKDLTTQLSAIDSWIQDQIATVPEGDRKLITTHDAFRYYANAYDLSVAGALSGISTEEEPSPQRLIELVDQVKDANVKAIFAETTTNTRTIEAIARDANVAVAPQPLFVEGPGGEGTAAETYQAMLIVNTCTIVDALGGTCAFNDAPTP